MPNTTHLLRASGPLIAAVLFAPPSAHAAAIIYNLGTYGGTFSAGYAVNAAGQVVGESAVPGDAAHAYLYTPTPGGGGATMADLGSLGGTPSKGMDINASGQVAGYSYTSTTGNDYHAFLYTGTPGIDGTMYDLGTLGGASSKALGINAAGQITGHSSTSGGPAHAFLYTGIPGNGGAMLDLGTLGGTSEGYAINDDGQITGSSETSVLGHDFHAFLYTGIPGAGGAMIDLDAWLDAVDPIEGAKWTLTVPSGLTDTGLITGYGTYDDGPGGLTDGTRAFLLDASALIPEPTTLWLFAAGSLSFQRRRRGD